MDHLTCFCALCFSCFRVCSLLPCNHLLGKGWPLGSCWWCLLYLCYFPMWYLGSGVVPDCIVFWSLPSFLLWKNWNNVKLQLRLKENGVLLNGQCIKQWSWTSKYMETLESIRTTSANSLKSDLECSRGSTLTLHNVTLASQKPCLHNNKCDCS